MSSRGKTIVGSDGTTMVKPKVGFLYSDGDKRSCESRNLATYLCGLISATGYPQVFMIPYQANELPGDLGNRRVKYIPPGSHSPKEVPVSDVTFTHFNALEDCDVIIVTLNSFDTKACCKKMSELLDSKKHITVFSIQRGVRNGSMLREALEVRGVTVLECTVGFAVVLDPKHSACVSTVQRPHMIIERLSREAIKVADGPVRLLEVMGIETSFRKILTPHSWGVLLFENIYALNVLTKGSLRDTLSRRDWRLVLSLMVRESYKGLHVAARGGEWKPNLMLVAPGYVTPWVLEMILVLPDFLFGFVFWALGMYPPAYLMSPGQLDLTEGRRSMHTWHFGEIVQACQRHHYEAPVCTLVYNRICSIERSMFPEDTDADATSGAAAGTTSYNSTPQAQLIDEIVRTIDQSSSSSSRDGALYSQHPTIAEWWYWISRLLALLSALFLLGFLLVHHDHY